MASSRTIVIAGAGIAGLSAAKALADRHFRVVLIEQADRLEETGAGIQLSPNATRALFALGLEDRLKPHAVAPDAVSIKQAQNGREIARIALGREIAFRYGTPYWVVHRADLQAALLGAVTDHPDITLQLGMRVEDFAAHAQGVTVQMRHGIAVEEERGIALIGADGLWSAVRSRLGFIDSPVFQYRTAWRALVDAQHLRDEFREPVVHLWLGRDAHLVHYPVSGGRRVNIVAIVNDRTPRKEWSAPGAREDVMARFKPGAWATPARDLMNEPDRWQSWSLYDRPAQRRWGTGAVTLIGDAAHPGLPYLAQGAAMAVEDAVTLAKCLADKNIAVPAALRMYEGLRRRRTARVQAAARFTGALYHLGGPQALARNVALGAVGQERLRERYDWLYDWRRV